MSEDKSQPTLGETKGSQAARIGTSVLGAIPGLGPIIQATITETIPNIRLERIETFLRHLDSRIDETLLAAKLCDERNLDLFEEGVWQSVRAVSEERKQRIANLVVHGLNSEGEQVATTRHWLRILNQLGDEDIACLWDEYAWQIAHPDPEDAVIMERDEALSGMERSRRVLLFSYGLVNMASTWDRLGVIEGVTESGVEFLRYLDLIEAAET